VSVLVALFPFAERLTAFLKIVEMLEAFSSSADKSVSLRDFERMMVAAKLA
jgi:hypothetical protein